MDPVETIINLYPTPEEGWDLVEILLRSHPVVTFLENLLPGDCDTVVATLKNLLRTQPEPLRRDCDTVVAALENLLRVSPAPALQTQPEPLRRDCDTVVAASVESLLRLYPSPEEQRELLRMVDCFSRWTEACPLPDQTAQSVADAFFHQIVCRFGMPIVIHSDQGREFENKIMQELCIMCDSHKTRTTPYHPESDGLMERFNRTLLMMLAMFASKNRDDWDDGLSF